MNENNSKIKMKKKMHKRKKPKYRKEKIIQVLEFLREQRGNPISHEKIREHFKNDFAIDHYLRLLRPDKETEYIRRAFPDDENCNVYIISEKGLFKLFDYEQLKLTRRISIIAIIIAVFSVVATIAVSVFQIVS